MTQSLVLIGLFLGTLVSLPFLIERIKKHYGLNLSGPGGPARLVSALSLGPHQKVVTVEVGPQSARVWLVLGVTQQNIQCLHTMAADVTKSSTDVPTSAAAPVAAAQQIPHENA
jgi:flagellar protein FliO/FliZ